MRQDGGTGHSGRVSNSESHAQLGEITSLDVYVPVTSSDPVRIMCSSLYIIPIVFGAYQATNNHYQFPSIQAA